MNDIPEDVRRRAGDALLAAGHMLRVGDKAHEAIAYAILAERERCAKIAYAFPNMGEAMGREIAAIIRVGVK